MLLDTYNEIYEKKLININNIIYIIIISNIFNNIYQ